MEMAPRGRVQGGWDFTLDRVICAPTRFELWDLIQQGLGIGMARAVKQILRRRNFHNATKIHHDNPICDMFDDA
jgi:hypothetical protein